MPINLNVKKSKSNTINYYSNISDAIKDYVNEIKDNFIAKLEIKTDKPGLSLDYLFQLQTFIFGKAKEEFWKIGKTAFINNNEIINVSNSDIKESIAKTVRNRYQKWFIFEHLELFSHLDKIIEKSDKIAIAVERKSRYQNLNWEYYIIPITINNEKYVVQFDCVLKECKEKHLKVLRIFKFEDIKSGYFNR